MKILIIHGPNLNLLGQRDPNKYGKIGLNQINKELVRLASRNQNKILCFQSNHEGFIIDFIQEHSGSADGIIINPGALVRYAYSLRAALIDANLPVIEVHLSDINKTGINKSVNVLQDVVKKQIVGKKELGYYQALDELVALIRANSFSEGDLL